MADQVNQRQNAYGVDQQYGHKPAFFFALGAFPQHDSLEYELDHHERNQEKEEGVVCHHSILLGTIHFTPSLQKPTLGPRALVVQRIEQIRPKDKMVVQFRPGAPN